MIKQRNSIRPLELLLGVIILYSIMPILQQFFSDYLTTYTFMVILLGTVIYVMTIRGTASLADSIMVLIPFILWMLLDYLTTGPSLLLWGYSSMLLLAPLLFGSLAVLGSGPRVVRFLAILLGLALLGTAISTIIGSLAYPEAARYLATVKEAKDYVLQFYNHMNIGGYEFVYYCVLLYPAVIFAYKKRKIHLISAILASLLVLFLTLQTGYTTAFLLWIATTATFFFPRNLKKRWVLILLIATILILVLFLPLFSSGIKALSKIIDNEDISYRLDALSGGNEGIRASEDDRISLYEMSIKSFFRSPLFGGILKGGALNGGHSFLLDFAANYGLVGIVLLVLMYRIIYTRFFKPFELEPGYGYIFWMFLQPIILSSINTGMWINVLCWFLPVSVIAILQKGEIKRRENPVDREYNAE